MIKVGDRIRAWGGHTTGTIDRRGGTCYEGEVTCLLTASSEVLKLRDKRGSVQYAWKSTAELLPALIDWTKPLRTVGGLQVDFVGTLAQPDKSGMKRVVCVHGPEGGVVHTVKENGQLAIANVPGNYGVENVPPPKLRAKRTLVLRNDGLGGSKMELTCESIDLVKSRWANVKGLCEVELVEGEGME